MPFKDRKHGPIAAYVLIVAVAMLGFWNADRDDEQMCESALENREAIRSLANATDTLGRDLVLDGKPESKADPDERRALDRIAKFREEQEKLLSAPVCD